MGKIDESTSIFRYSLEWAECNKKRQRPVCTEKRLVVCAGIEDFLEAGAPK
jgi:hypothetical protein